MKLTTPLSLLAPLATLLGSATANFDVYQDDEYHGNGKSGFLVFNNDPSCEDVLKAPFFKIRPDVSGNNKGVKQYILRGVSDFPFIPSPSPYI
jgi:hypothetical protein